MRANSTIVLLTIAVSIFSPVSVHLAIAHGQTSIGSFDVCHPGSPALSTSQDAPSVSQPIYRFFLPLWIERAEIREPAIRPFMSTFQEEHPPKF